MDSILQMQRQLTTIKQGTIDTVRIADEINYTNERLGKAFTAGEKINRELEIRKRYERKFTEQIVDLTTYFVDVWLPTFLIWNDVPNELVLDFRYAQQRIF